MGGGASKSAAPSAGAAYAPPDAGKGGAISSKGTEEARKAAFAALAKDKTIFGECRSVPAHPRTNVLRDAR